MPEGSSHRVDQAFKMLQGGSTGQDASSRNMAAPAAYREFVNRSMITEEHGCPLQNGAERQRLAAEAERPRPYAAEASAQLPQQEDDLARQLHAIALSLPPGWIMQRTEAHHQYPGRPYYVNTATRESSWTPPTPSPQHPAVYCPGPNRGRMR